MGLYITSIWAIFCIIDGKRYYYSGTKEGVRLWRTERNKAAVWQKKPECEEFHQTLGRGTIELMTL